MTIDLSAASASELLLLGLGLLAGAFVLGVLVVLLLRRAARRWNLTVLSGRLWQSPVVAVIMASAIQPVVAEADRRWAPGLAHLLTIVQIWSIGWLAVVLVRTAAKAALAKHPETGLRDERSRHVRTKIALIQRVAIAAVATLVIGATLWTFPSVRAVGVTVLASAGILSIIAGLAAQTSLANMFAGIQIAFTDGIRVGDIVVVEGRQGRIEEITLTYIVIQIWNETRLILPCTYFTTTPFENWSHSGNTAIGEVAVTTGWAVPVPAVRTELTRILAASPLWDGRVAELRVGDTAPAGVVLLAQFSAASDAVEVLKFQVRESLIAFLAAQGEDVLPRARIEQTHPNTQKGTT
ncbi:mechanosensitive ion channel family protein [Agromyces aurantiacus]|uniref:Mechanosensitive ion channel family protein n=1 Tax=Agromyces aurantiacus TaxID=165814 RepID=A0ABV9RA46_9MICO|nr:mechanosensitive ion channel domain-containing protein [Agromyces aurantiacus]MBM7505401.1 small-conductance mechanosensitive channel [Agromyces aurantiacus]